MTSILQRAIGPSLPVAAGGGGVLLRDTTGAEYIDASGGAAVSCLGHHVLLAPPFVVDAATIDSIVDRLGEAVDAAVATVRAVPAA